MSEIHIPLEAFTLGGNQKRSLKIRVLKNHVSFPPFTLEERSMVFLNGHLDQDVAGSSPARRHFGFGSSVGRAPGCLISHRSSIFQEN